MSDESSSGLELSFAESRVLGCLLEKEVTTPDAYPMTLNGLQNACNQKSSRDPVTEFDEATVERALDGLRDKHLAAKVHLSGSRVAKYRHTIDKVFNFSDAQRALVGVLMLRGIQTSGELNQRTERLHKFGSTSAVEHALHELIDDPAGPFVREIPAGAGRRTKTFVHLLCGEPKIETAPAAAPVSAEQIVLEEEASWRKKLEDEVAVLRAELSQVREEFAEFRRQFE